MLPHNFFVVVFNCVFIETHSAITWCSVKKTNKQKKKAQQLIKNKQNDDKLNFSWIHWEICIYINRFGGDPILSDW